MTIQKEKIVSRLIARNTVAPDLKKELLDYENSENMKKVLSLIAVEWSEHNGLKDLSNFALFEIPHPDVFCFFNVSKSFRPERFDVYLNNYNGNGKECTFGYVGCTKHGCISYDADSAEEAIKNYI